MDIGAPSKELLRTEVRALGARLKLETSRPKRRFILYTRPSLTIIHALFSDLSQ